MKCHCGGLLRFDLQHLQDAVRLGLREEVSLFWKCMVCGRTRKSDESYPLSQVVASLERFTTPIDAQASRR
ncbi:MAG: hypothetical protein DME11_08330 [Candidatus Rokuibacteriota bacterium]|nr:MAG: hypothetical protein DME11_08330 [Candidatus Rokubacteria bacterium]